MKPAQRNARIINAIAIVIAIAFAYCGRNNSDHSLPWESENKVCDSLMRAIDTEMADDARMSVITPMLAEIFT